MGDAGKVGGGGQPAQMLGRVSGAKWSYGLKTAMSNLPTITPDLADRAEHEMACAYCLRFPVFPPHQRVCEQCQLEVRLGGSPMGLGKWRIIQGIRDRCKQQAIERRKERYGR